MEFLSEFSKRLDSDGEPLAKRLCLAQRAFHSAALAVPLKEELILGWLSGADRSSEDVWLALQSCLSADHLTCLSPAVASSVVKMVCEGLNSDMVKSTRQVVYSCAHKVLDSSVFQWSLKKCVQEYLDIIVAIFEEVEDHKSFLKIVACVKGYHNSLVDNKDEFVKGFVKRALFPLLKLFDDISSTLLVTEKATDLRTTLVTLLQQILFPEQESSSQVQFISHLFGNEGENVPCDKNSVLPLVFSELHAALNQYPKSLSVTGYCIVFQSFICMHNTNHAVIVKFLRVLFYLVGFKSKFLNKVEENTLELNEPVMKEISKPAKRKAVSYAVVSGLVKTLTDVSFVLEGECEMSLMNVLVGLCVSSTQKSKEQSVCAEFLKMCSSVIYYSPVTMAPKLFDFLVPVMLIKKCDDVEVSYAYLEFLHCVLEVFFKLSRVYKLFTKLLPLLRDALSVENNADLVLDDVVPRDFCKQLCLKVMVLPSAQIFSTIKCFCYHLKEDFDNPLVQKKSGSASRLYLQVLESLVCTFLRGVKVACHSVPALVASTFARHLAELEGTLSGYAAALLARPCEDWELAALLGMCHSVGEVHLLLANYRPGARSAGLGWADSGTYDMAGLHPYIAGDLWQAIHGRVSSCKGQSAAKDKLDELLLQKLAALQLLGGAEDTRPRQAGITAHLASLASPHSAWLAPGLPLLSPLLDGRQLLSLARTLLLDPPAPLHRFLRDDAKVIETLVWVCVEQIGSKLAQCLSDETGSFPFRSQEELTMYFLKRFSCGERSEDSLSPLLTSLGRVVTAACEGGSVFQSDSLKLVEVQMLEQHVGVLKALPVRFLSVDVQRLVALTAVLLAECLRKIDPDSPLIGVLCGDVLLGASVGIGSLACRLLDAGALLNKLRQRLLFHRLFAIHFLHDGALEDLQPFLRRLTAADSPLDASLGALSALLFSLHKLNREQIVKNETFLQEAVLMPACEIVATVKAEHCEQDSANLEVFANILSLELKMTKFVVIKQHLSKFITIALAGLHIRNDGQVHNCTVFIKLLLQHREKLTEFLPKDFVVSVWTASSTHVSEQLGRLVLEAASDEEFDTILTSLLQKTRDRLNSQSANSILMMWWQSVVISSLASGKSAIRQTAVERLCESLLASLDHCYEGIVEILKMEEALISNPQVRMVPHVADLCLLSVSSVPSPVVEERFPEVWPAMLSVLHQLHTHRPAWLWDRLPGTLQCYRRLFSALAQLADVGRSPSPLAAGQVATGALGLTKFTDSLVGSKQHLKRVCPYIIADMLHEMDIHNIHPSVKVHFQNCINCLLSMSDENEVMFLLRTLKPADRELFKSLYQKYKKHFQFTGKI
ncbi:uncharacterized protein LOC134534764 isoform X2 [Bacillus rossius redtenbacheri]|uniref:uncharacterized protein LOC134534764 isoform X2 n=1 Tax=Bacillus rossius redtenbacheri TaxID=93214 RepID=UPI002FDE8EA5